MYVKFKKFGYLYNFLKVLHTYAFSDESNIEKVKKVVKNLIQGVRIWTLVNPTFFMINPN